MTDPAARPPAPGAPLRARVVRADRGVLLVVPDDDLGAPARRVDLPRDGLLPRPDGTRVPPAVGDVVDVADGEPPHAVALHARRTELVRDSANRTSHEQVVAANVDVVLVVEHLDPDPDLGRVERLLTLAWRSGARPVVVRGWDDAAGRARQDVLVRCARHQRTGLGDKSIREPLRARHGAPPSGVMRGAGRRRRRPRCRSSR